MAESVAHLSMSEETGGFHGGGAASGEGAGPSAVSLAHAVAGVAGMATSAGATAVVGKPSSPPSTSSPLPRGGDGGGEEALMDSTM